ncbi:MAG: DsrE family protein [Campylobacterota bacterium]|nr:DsrE family protein [Campylobacterota bacterium]
MKKILSTVALASLLVIPTISSASQAKGLNVLVNSDSSQTQAMAMVLSLMTIKKHKKEVNIVLCGAAGDLAHKNIKGVPTKRPDGKAPSAKQHLQALIKLGADVKVCPLYLPNKGVDKSILIDGVTVAKPPVVAGKLLNKDFQNITF